MSQDGDVIHVDGELTIYTAAESLQQFTDRLNATKQLVLNLAGVTEMDSAGIQVLLLLKSAATAQEKVLRFTAPSAAVQFALETLNLQFELDAPAAQEYAGGIS